MERDLGGLESLSREELEHRFERRTQARRARYTSYLTLIQVGMVVALSAVIFLFNLEISIGEVKTFKIAEQELVTMEEIAQTVQEVKPPPPPRPPVPVIVPDDLVLDNEEFEFDAMLDIREALAIAPPPPAVEIEVDSEPEIFMAVESMPEMIGGIRALFDEIEYPSFALRAGISGTVIVQIVVGEDGRPRDPEIIRGVMDSLDKEAIRAILLLKFIPGKQRGRPVPVYMNIPVRYRIR